jgi:hypothetical protein
VKITPTYLQKAIFLAFLLVLAVTPAGCQQTGGTLIKTVPSKEGSQGSPTEQKAQTAAQTNPASSATGDFNLPILDVGLETLESYSQSYSFSMKGTYQGQPHESSEKIDRVVNSDSETNQVISTTTGEQPFFLQFVRLGNYVYTQEKEAQPCRATDRADKEGVDLNPVNQLPTVSGGVEVGQESVGAIPAVHYRFDENAVRKQSGKNGKAQGDVWVAVDGGQVLNYQLTVEIKDGDFLGTKSWTYELQEIDQNLTVQLPKGCLPMLSDIPRLPDARAETGLPGFIRYSVSSSLEDAIQFYERDLSGLGWQELPGDKQGVGSALLKFSRLLEDGTGQILGIQFSVEGGFLQVIIQLINTQKPIQVETQSAPPEEESTEPAEDAPEGALPDDIPIYPGATVLQKSQAVIFLQSSDPADKIAQYYKTEMLSLGFSQIAGETNGPIITQGWVRDGISVGVQFLSLNGNTQIYINLP